MDLTPYVEHLRRDLAAAAEAASPEVAAAAERLAFALDPAVRLALMEALSQAAAEITTAMPGSVEVRLAGRELEFVTTEAPPAAALTSPVPAAADDTPDSDNSARLTVRLPESVKAAAEGRAAAAGQSLNTWLVHTIRAAARDAAVNVEIDLTSIPFGKPSGRRLTGWL